MLFMLRRQKEQERFLPSRFEVLKTKRVDAQLGILLRETNLGRCQAANASEDA